MNSNHCKSLSVYPYELEAPGLSAGRRSFMGECAAMCLNLRHRSGVKLIVNGEHSTEFALNWNDLSNQHLQSLRDLQEATEHGACGLAILVVTEITGKTVVERAAKGLGFDFWLGDKEGELPFQGCSRLEISGILHGDDSDIWARLREKRKQVAISDGLAPAYVAVIEFSGPIARIECRQSQ